MSFFVFFEVFLVLVDGLGNGHRLKKKYSTSPIIRYISMIQSITDITQCGNISYSVPGDSRIKPSLRNVLVLSGVGELDFLGLQPPN